MVVEGALRQLHIQHIARLGAGQHLLGKAAAGNLADLQRDTVALLWAGHGEAAVLATGQADVQVLAGCVLHAMAFGKIQRQMVDIGSVQTDFGHRGTQLRGRRAGRPGFHADHQIGLRARLAGQRIALGVFFVAHGQRQLAVGIGKAAFLHLHAAGAAAAESAVVRQIHALARGGIEHRFVGAHLKRLLRLQPQYAVVHHQPFVLNF